MAIDLTACIGCSACVVACQAENNIPVVGKEQVARGREMHWLRIDRYLRGRRLDAARETFTSSRCRACTARTPRASSSARSRPRCTAPTGSTTWSTTAASARGTARTTARTRCGGSTSSQYADLRTPTACKLLRNPDVTVRSRGVMEKCTYCVQRIRAAEIEARDARTGRSRDGEMLTACQAACPAEAIVFGDLNDTRAARSRSWKDEPLNYGLLAELNTRPRTTYLAALRNPNPDTGADGVMATASRGRPNPDAERPPADGDRRRHRPGLHVRLGHRQDQRHRADAADRRAAGGSASASPFALIDGAARTPSATC